MNDGLSKRMRAKLRASWEEKLPFAEYSVSLTIDIAELQDCRIAEREGWKDQRIKGPLDPFCNPAIF